MVNMKMKKIASAFLGGAALTTSLYISSVYKTTENLPSVLEPLIIIPESIAIPMPYGPIRRVPRDYDFLVPRIHAYAMSRTSDGKFICESGEIVEEFVRDSPMYILTKNIRTE